VPKFKSEKEKKCEKCGYKIRVSQEQEVAEQVRPSMLIATTILINTPNELFLRLYPKRLIYQYHTHFKEKMT
jgi:hypothetical protein